jgi:uncharacterized protein
MESYDPDQRKLLSTLCHGACFFSATVVAVGIPIAVLALTKDPVIKANAKEALNFQITLFLGVIVSFFLVFVLVGFFFFFILAAISLIFPIIAMLSILAEPDKPYRYPIICRLV